MNIKEFFVWGQELLRQSPETQHLNFDDNSPNTDIVLKAFTALAYQLHLDLEQVRLGQSLQNSELMEADQMEALIANVFLERRPGSFARVSQTLYFRKAVDFTITTDNTFFSLSGKNFKVAKTFSGKAFQLRREVVNTTEYWAVDVPLIAVEEGEESRVPAGDINGTNAALDKFVFTVNKSAATGGYGTENNAQLKSRGERAIATRDNVSDNSIFTVFNEAFGDILDLFSVGYLDPDMQRDVLRASGCWFHHNGGMTDSYVKMELISMARSVKCLSNTSGTVAEGEPCDKFFRVRGLIKNVATRFLECLGSGNL